MHAVTTGMQFHASNMQLKAVTDAVELSIMQGPSDTDQLLSSHQAELSRSSYGGDCSHARLH